MFKVTLVEERCDGCGACRETSPRLFNKLQEGPIEIRRSFADRDVSWHALCLMVRNCVPEALSLELTGEHTACVLNHIEGQVAKKGA